MNQSSISTKVISVVFLQHAMLLRKIQGNLTECRIDEAIDGGSAIDCQRWYKSLSEANAEIDRHDAKWGDGGDGSGVVYVCDRDGLPMFGALEH